MLAPLNVINLESQFDTFIWGALDGENTCSDLLLEPLNELVVTKKLPFTMRVQLENCAINNKNILLFAYRALLVAKGISKEVFIYNFYI